MDALSPLQERYNAQHYNLRRFYYECSNLKYLTGLINVPKLGQVSCQHQSPIKLTARRNPPTSSMLEGQLQSYQNVQHQNQNVRFLVLTRLPPHKAKSMSNAGC